MPDTAIARPGYTPGTDNASNVAAIEAWLTRKLHADPSFQIPPGYKVHNGQVYRDTGSKLLTAARILPYIGMGAAGGIGVAGAVSGSGAAAAGGIPALPTATAGLPAGLPGATAAGGGNMSILSSFGNFFKNPRNILGMAKDLAPVLGGASRDRAAAQQSAERSQLGRDNINLSAAEDRDRSLLSRAGLDLQRKDFQLAAPGKRLSTGVQGSMVGNAHNVTVGTGAPLTLPSGRTINPIHYGGMGPDDLLSPEARQLGDQVTHDMLLQQMGGDKFDDLPTTQFPNATPAAGSSALDKLIGGGATVTSILGALSGAKRPNRRMSLAGTYAYGADDPNFLPE